MEIQNILLLFSEELEIYFFPLADLKTYMQIRNKSIFDQICTSNNPPKEVAIF